MNSDDDEIDYETVVDYRMKASDDKAMNMSDAPLINAIKRCGKKQAELHEAMKDAASPVVTASLAVDREPLALDSPQRLRLLPKGQGRDIFEACDSEPALAKGATSDAWISFNRRGDKR